MRYDLNLLPVFVALMEERSVTRAAQRLGLTQPALSNALTRLRTTMRDPLFVRERYGIRPTEMAEELAPVIAEALARIEDVILVQQEFDPARAARLLTIAPNSHLEFVLVPGIVARLRELGTRHQAAVDALWQRSGRDRRRLRNHGDGPGPHRRSPGQSGRAASHGRNSRLRGAGGSSGDRREHLARTVRAPQACERAAPGRLRAGLFQALQRQGLKREVAVSVTHFLAVPEIVAVTDYCATLPRLICRHLARDPRLKILPTPVDLGTFPVEMAWHVRYRHDPAHRWLRSLVGEVARDLATRPAP